MSKPTDVVAAPWLEALDSEALEAPGAFRDAHTLGVLERSSNRLIARGHTLFSLTWDALDVDTERATAYPQLPGWLRWTPVLRGPILRPKRPTLRFLDVIVRARLPEDQVIFFQCETSRSQLDPNAGPSSPKVLALVGTGAEVKYALRGLAVDPGPWERIQLYQRGLVTDTLGDDAVFTNSGSNVGRVGGWYDDGLFEGPIVGSDWWPENDSLASSPPRRTWAPDHGIKVYSGALGSSSVLFEGNITSVRSSYQAYVDPVPSAAFRRAVRGKHFGIYELPSVRYYSIAGFLQDRFSEEVGT